MKSAVHFLGFLFFVLVSGGQHVHAGNALAIQHRQAATIKSAFSPSGASRAELKAPASNHQTTNLDSVIIDDEDDDEETVGKYVPVLKYSTVVLTLCAMPPPAAAASKSVLSTHLSSLLHACRYLAHRALLI